MDSLPKMNILSSFIQPHVIPNPNDLLFCGTLKITYFAKCHVSIFVHTMVVRELKRFGYQRSSKYLLLFHRRKKVIKVWNEMRVSK